MSKYKVGQSVKVRNEWYQIESERFDLSDGKRDYLVSNENRRGWIGEEKIEAVSTENKVIH